MFPWRSLSRMPTLTAETSMGDDSSVAWPLIESSPPERLNLMLVGSLCATGHGGVLSQSGSTQSVLPSQSLSIMSLQISGDGTQGCVVVVLVDTVTVVVDDGCVTVVDVVTCTIVVLVVVAVVAVVVVAVVSVVDVVVVSVVLVVVVATPPEQSTGPVAGAGDGATSHGVKSASPTTGSPVPGPSP